MESRPASSTKSSADHRFVPEYLRPFVATQDATLYTPMDHASWRFILKISRSFFASNAHQKYLDGLRETGISTDRIPLIEEMDAQLQRFGWRAVAVSGFIPPAVFMEFQSLGILPIACEMRTLDHLAYTPAPDIVHEAAGHAPIIADPEYAQYLRNYGEVARKAIFSSQDMDVYEAVRNLSVVKEDPLSTPSQIDAAQMQLDQATANVRYESEATLLARMNWWTVEYGLVGSVENPKIYGAGLLSSVGESYSCLKPPVRHIPLTLDCVNTSYDITRPQPQLFVTPDFQHLTGILNEFAATMAFRQGGAKALAKAVQAATVTTTLLDSGLQIAGKLAEYRLDAKDQISYLKFAGPTQLAYRDQELPNQGPTYHREGFSTAIGRLKSRDISPAELSDAELKTLTSLSFESGIEVKGRLIGHVREGMLLILSFADCTVTQGSEILFQPAWGTFDLACGERVTSVFGGAADRQAYLAQTGGFAQAPMIPKCNLTPENRELNALYADLRRIRDAKTEGTDLLNSLTRIESALERDHPEDWLLRWEILELARLRLQTLPFEARIQTRLDAIGAKDPVKKELITRGRSTLTPA